MMPLRYRQLQRTLGSSHTATSLPIPARHCPDNQRTATTIRPKASDCGGAIEKYLLGDALSAKKLEYDAIRCGRAAARGLPHRIIDEDQ